MNRLIPKLDPDLDAPVVIIQHMPKGFTFSLAKRLDGASDIPVSEVVHGQVLEKGHVYLTKGGTHLGLERNSLGELVAFEEESDPINGLKPCADITLSSLNRLSFDLIVCAVLTGMGKDGYEGIQKLSKMQPTYTIAQNKETCVVYGMPKAIVEQGLADQVLPLEQISKEINKKVGVF